MHDLVLSPEPAREVVFAEMDRWLNCYHGNAKRL